MTLAQWAALGSSLLGAVGTALLFFFSYTDEPYQGGVFGSPSVTKFNEDVKAKNKKWKLRQRTGFGLLCLSFLIQAWSVFLPSV